MRVCVPLILDLAQTGAQCRLFESGRSRLPSCTQRGQSWSAVDTIVTRDHVLLARPTVAAAAVMGSRELGRDLGCCGDEMELGGRGDVDEDRRAVDGE